MTKIDACPTFADIAVTVFITVSERVVRPLLIVIVPIVLPLPCRAWPAGGCWCVTTFNHLLRPGRLCPDDVALTL